MKTVKKTLALVLALVMTLALVVPAMAVDEANDVPVSSFTVDKVETENDSTGILDAVDSENGFTFSTAPYVGIVLKQDNTTKVIWTPAELTAEGKQHFIAQLTGVDKHAGVDAFTWIYGEQAATYYGKNEGGFTLTVSGGQMTLKGTISHIGFGGAERPEVPDDNGTTSASFDVYKRVVGDNNLAGFEFAIFDSDGNRVDGIASAKSDATGNVSFTEVQLAPGTYTVKEINLDTTKYEENHEEIIFTVNADGSVAFEVDEETDEELNTFTNVYKLGKLKVHADVAKTWNDEYHKLVYKYYEYGTLVAGINPKTGNNALPKGVEGDYLGNGMTYLTIDKSALANGPIELNISQSNKSGNYKKTGTDKWNTPVAGDWTFTLSMNEQGQLVVDASAFADIMDPAEGKTPAFGAKVYAINETVNGCRDIKHNNQTTYDLPDSDPFKFFIHWENSRYTLGEIIGCEVEREELRVERITDEVNLLVTKTVVAEDGTTYEPIYNGKLVEHPSYVAPVDYPTADDYTVTLEDLEPGEYNVTISWKDEEISTQTVDVAAGETESADFGKQFVTVPNVVVECPYVPTYGTEHGIFPDKPIDPTMPIAG